MWLLFFSSVSEESCDGIFDGGGASVSGAAATGTPGDYGDEKENLLPNDQSDSKYLTNYFLSIHEPYFNNIQGPR